MPNIDNTFSATYLDGIVAHQADSNVVTFDLLPSVLTLVKAQSKSSGYSGDIITYTLTLSNIGATELTAVEITDNLSSSIEYVPGTFTIDSVVQPDPDFSQPIIIGTIPVLGVVVIEFDVKVL